MEWYRALYLLGNMRLKGYATPTGYGTYWFRPDEHNRPNKGDLPVTEAGAGKRDLFVTAEDLKVVIETGEVT